MIGNCCALGRAKWAAHYSACFHVLLGVLLLVPGLTHHSVTMNVLLEVGQELCPSSAAFFGFMGVTCALVFASACAPPPRAAPPPLRAPCARC